MELGRPDTSVGGSERCEVVGREPLLEDPGHASQAPNDEVRQAAGLFGSLEEGPVLLDELVQSAKFGGGIAPNGEGLAIQPTSAPDEHTSRRVLTV